MPTHTIPPGPFPGTCAHMPYVPRSQMNFAGDIQHDLRDVFCDQRAETVALWAGEAAHAYLGAARLLGQRDDPVADCLAAEDRFDVWTLQVAHDRLAAYWRATRLAEALADPGKCALNTPRAVPRSSYHALLVTWRAWLIGETRAWARTRPGNIRLICLILVQQNVTRGRVAEMDLYDAIKAQYPLPEGG